MDIDEAKRRASKGPRMLMARRAVLLLVTFISTVTVARLVSPRDYGLASMSIVVTSFAQVFRDFGVTNAVMRRARVDQGEMSVIFWFNLLSTTLISGALIAIAPAASDFYHEPIVKWTIIVSVVGFQLGGAAMMHRALLNRDLRFNTVALIDILAALIGFVVTLAIAFIRHDVWAIVVGNVAQTVSGAVLAIVLGRWRPGRPARHPEFWSVLRFGANSAVYSMSVFASRNAPVVMIGNVFGSAPLGQFNRAQALFNIPGMNLAQPIAQATMPLLTRLREHEEEYRQAYLKLVRQLCVFLMPLSVTLCLAAGPLVEALLGERWHEAGVLLAVLAPAMAATGIAFTVSDVFVTQDRSGELRTLGIIEVVVRIGAVGIGLFFGLVWTALGFTLATVFVVCLRVAVAGRKGPVTVRDQVVAAAAGLLPTLGAGTASTIAVVKGPDAAVLDAVVILGAGALGALLAGCTTPLSRQGLRDLFELFTGRSRAQARRDPAPNPEPVDAEPSPEQRRRAGDRTG